MSILSLKIQLRKHLLHSKRPELLWDLIAKLMIQPEVIEDLRQISYWVLSLSVNLPLRDQCKKHYYLCWFFHLLSIYNPS